MPTVVWRGQQSVASYSKLDVLCCTQRLVCCLLVHYQWSDISGGQLSLDTSHPEVTLSCFYGLGSESLAQQRRKSCIWTDRCKKKEGMTHEMQVPQLAARGQIVADSAETGQWRCCSHGPPAFVLITATDLKQKNPNKSTRCLILTPSHRYWYQY